MFQCKGFLFFCFIYNIHNGQIKTTHKLFLAYISVDLNTELNICITVLTVVLFISCDIHMSKCHGIFV